MNNDKSSDETDTKNFKYEIDSIKGEISIPAKSVRYTVVIGCNDPNNIIEKLKIMDNFNGLKIVSATVQDIDKIKLGLLDIKLINTKLHNLLDSYDFINNWKIILKGENGNLAKKCPKGYDLPYEFKIDSERNIVVN